MKVLNGGVLNGGMPYRAYVRGSRCPDTITDNAYIGILATLEARGLGLGEFFSKHLTQIINHVTFRCFVKFSTDILRSAFVSVSICEYLWVYFFQSSQFCTWTLPTAETFQCFISR